MATCLVALGDVAIAMRAKSLGSSVRFHVLSARPGSRLLIWLLPFLVAVAVRRLSDHVLEYGIAAGVALLVLRAATRRPGRALVALAVFLPLQTVGFGFLLALHVPGTILHAAGGTKDLLVLAMVVAAIRHRRNVAWRLRGVDKLALAYLGVVTAYLIVPHLFASAAPSEWKIRLLAWRADCGYVVVFLAARLAPIPESSRRWFIRIVLAIGGLTVLMGLYQFASPYGFSRFMLVTGRQVQYEMSVLGEPAKVVSRNLAYLTSFSPLRVSSIFFSPFDMSDYLVIVLAVVAERLARGYRNRSAYLLLAGVLFLLFASRVRADAIAAIVLILVALVPNPRRPVMARLGFLLALGIGLVVIIPSLSGTRFVGAQGGTSSAHDHLAELSYGVSVIESHPLGLGLGDNPATGDRFILPGQGAFISDNSVLQVADELGILALLPWLAFVVAALLALRRRARSPELLVSSAGLALLGVLIAGEFHQALLSYPISWTLWALVGVGLNPLTAAAEEAPGAPSASIGSDNPWLS